jgi:hypothetical protein
MSKKRPTDDELRELAANFGNVFKGGSAEVITDAEGKITTIRIELGDED